MHRLVLLIFGLLLVIGILIYYIVSTSPGKGSYSDDDDQAEKKRLKHGNVPDDLRKEDNVIFLPTSDQARQEQNEGSTDAGISDQNEGSTDAGISDQDEPDIKDPPEAPDEPDGE